MSLKSESPYRTRSTEMGFVVEGDESKLVLQCGDQQSAEQYVVLMNQAYRRGYKAGYRSARQVDNPN